MTAEEGDSYTRGGMPQSRYCEGCAHYQPLQESTPKGSARVCLYILHTGRQRGCPPGPGCGHRVSEADWGKTPAGNITIRARKRSRRGGKRKGSGK